MKRSKIYILPMLLVIAFLMYGCTKKKEEKTLENCDELYSDFYAATIAFSTEATEANCIAYENAVVKLLENCSLYTGVNKAELQEWLDENDCSQYAMGK